MVANILIMVNIQLLLEKKIKELFEEENPGLVEEELFKWLIFAYFGKGSSIKELDSLDFELFKDKLILLVDAIYNWHQERKSRSK